MTDSENSNSDTAQELGFLKNIGLMLTYRCTVSCPHCIVEGGPHRKEEIQLSDCIDWIHQARDFRDGYIQGLAITGGEPFFDLRRLERITTLAGELDFIVSVVTNAHWARSYARAHAVLSRLPAVQLLSVSTDEYHQKCISLDNVQNAVVAARELGKQVSIAVNTDTEENPHFRDTIERLLGFVDRSCIKVSITYPVGRARNGDIPLDHKTSVEPCQSACQMCSSPVVFPSGVVTACVGPVIRITERHPLQLGNIRHEPLSLILERAEENPVLHAIRIWGPHYVVEMLREEGLEEFLPKQYIADCGCDVCYRLFSSEEVNKALERIMRDYKRHEEIAYGRLYYLGETKMLEIGSYR